VTKFNAAWVRAHATIQRYFPEHQIYFRTNGMVRYWTISTRAQVSAVAISACLVGWLAVASGSMLLKNDALSQKENALVAQRAQIAQMQNRMAALSSDIEDMKGSSGAVVQRFRQRNVFLEQLLNNRLQVNIKTAQPVSADVRQAQSAAEAALKSPPVDQQAALEAFRKYDGEQLAFVTQATRAADARYERIDKMLGKLKLNASSLTSQSPSAAMGGPLVRASFERGAYSALEPQFKELFLSWTKLDLLQRAMLSIPSYMPAKNFSFTSGFGYRFDPFNGGGAMHAGVDMAGTYGSAIYAAASGTVIKAGWQGGYGNCIEIDHGRGMSTRYGHLASIDVREGQKLNQGDVIGGMGSTGRSTGTHLHFEVRVDGQAVNPMPFLEAARDVFEIQQSVDTGAPLTEPAG
jgi:murein DD-endopeptidase MepM/ murein hydrolase activator NlpD